MSESLIPNAILFAFAAAAITTAGLGAVWVWHDWTRAKTGWFAAFAAGALISIAILHLLPNAFEAAPNAPAYLLAGFAGIALSGNVSAPERAH